MPERSNGAVSKTVVPSRVPWVRIPPSPPVFRFVMELFDAVLIRRGRLIGMAPRWKRGGLNGLCGFESRPLRQTVALRATYLMSCSRSKLHLVGKLVQFVYQAPASVQSRTHEPRQDRKVATVVLFRCAAAVTGA